MKRIKTIIGYAAESRFLAECKQDGEDGYAVVGYIPRPFQEPYHYSPTKEVLSWKGKRIILAEVRHRRYEVFEVEESMTIYEREEAAQEAFMAIWRGRSVTAMPGAPG